MTLWDVNPRLWHTHPMTEPIGLVVSTTQPQTFQEPAQVRD